MVKRLPDVSFFSVDSAVVGADDDDEVIVVVDVVGADVGLFPSCRFSFSSNMSMV